MMGAPIPTRKEVRLFPSSATDISIPKAGARFYSGVNRIIEFGFVDFTRL